MEAKRNPVYIAHESDGRVQTVLAHSNGTAQLCKAYAIEPLSDFLYLIGLMHDIGKYLDAFQKKIKYEPQLKVEHSICGAMDAKDYIPDSALRLIAELCIAGHHAGLPDTGTPNDSCHMATLRARLNRETEDFSAYKKELSIPQSDTTQLFDFLNCEVFRDRKYIVDQYAFLVRYCYSCLVDADSIDTRTFCADKLQVSPHADFAGCATLVADRIESFRCLTPLQKARNRLQSQVYGYIHNSNRIKLMNLPTGSGKTLCSIRFALLRALESGKKRIIYVAPRNAIIDQTATVFENLFGDKAQIVRHQSTFSYDDYADGDEDYRLTMKYACENWDCPMIITTAVQFFESVYSNRRGKLRKLHNMADSIIIFDEAHMMPVEYLQPCLQAITQITATLNSEAILLTATMPDYTRLFHTFTGGDISICDLAPDKSMYDCFRKFTCRSLGTVCCEELIEKSAENASSLVIVQTRKRAKELYALCPASNKYHLSTYMTPFDRMRVILQVAAKLTELHRAYPDLSEVPPEKRIVLFSTSLIEAGVDLDFQAVYRELTGLDSIIQSGGRCNREGRLKEAYLYVFKFDGNGRYNDIGASITEGLMQEYEDITAPGCVTAYYDRLLYTRQDEIVSHTLSRSCNKWNLIPFRTYADSFRLIEDRTVSVFVPRDEESFALKDSLSRTGYINSRKIQKYLAAVYRNEFDSLLRQGVVDDYGSGVYCLTNPDYYDENLGILLYGKDKFDEGGMD